MGLEVSDTISGLDETWPLGTDDKREGDNHLRLIKHVLRNTFPNATRSFGFPTYQAVTGNYSVVAADQNKFLVVDTTAGAWQLTMPTLTVNDYGWMVIVIKGGGANPTFIAPPSGVVVSGQITVAKARRAIPWTPFRVIWLGGSWIVERCAISPVGSVIPIFSSALPLGYEWPDGATLTVANYPEYAALVHGGGLKPDCRQRGLFGSNHGGGDVGRIQAGVTGIDGNTIFSAGGNQFLHQHQHNVAGGTSNELQAHAHGFNGSASVSGQTLGQSNDHTHPFTGGVGATGATFGGVGVSTAPSGSSTGGTSADHSHPFSGSGSCSGLTDAENAAHNHSFNVNSGLTGGGGSQNMPPAIICNMALVVE